MRKFERYAAVSALAATLLAGCGYTGGLALNAEEKGAITGGTVGTGTGALIGGATSGSAGAGALIGGVGGAAGGSLLGDRVFKDDPSRQ